jgi:DNA repair exonuclease SbcCD ATPase subunit
MCSVWVERLEITGFKRLSGAFEFDPDLTIVVGPNEAGKSSLGEALMRSVWGFDRAERRRRADGSRWERCRPWDGSQWRVVARLVDHDGRHLRAEWDFNDHRVRLLDAITGEDLSAGIDGARGDILLGAELTGVAYADFREVCCFDQHTLKQVQRSDSLVNALQRAVESVHTDVGVADADARLRDFLKTHVGARSDNYNLLANGPLKQELDEQERVIADIEAAHLDEAEVAKLAQELRRRELQRSVLADERVEVERAILVQDLAEARSVANEALRQLTLSREMPSGSTVVDERTAHRALAAFAVVDRIDATITEAQHRVNTAAPELSSARAHEAELSAAVRPLEHVGKVDRSGETEVREGMAQLRRLTAEPQPTIPAIRAPDPMLARYREIRGELMALASTGTVEWNGTRLIVATVVAAVSIGVAVAVTPVGLAGLVLAGGLIAMARMPQKSGGLADRLRDEFGVEDVNDLERRVREEDSAIATTKAEASAARLAVKARNDGRAELLAKLAQALNAVGAPDAPLEQRAANYLRTCDQYAALQQRAAELSDLRVRLSGMAASERDLAARRDERREALLELHEALADLEISTEDLAEARRDLDRRIAASKKAVKQLAEVSGAREALRALLGERTLDDLQADVARAQEQLDAHMARHPDAQDVDGELTELRDRLAGVDERLNEALRSATWLKAQIQERETRLPNVPELRERLAMLEARIDERQVWLEAIRIAREALSEAARQAHRNFAPHLQRALTRTLPLFTAGRYSDVTIGDDLTMAVVAPETGTQVPADCLSLATQDQIYLVQRLEIGKMLIPASGPVPLLLDEPFAEFDEDRERAAIEIVCREAESRQVVVFTKDPRLVDRIAAVRPAPHVIELQAPTTRVVTA